MTRFIIAKLLYPIAVLLCGLSVSTQADDISLTSDLSLSSLNTQLFTPLPVESSFSDFDEKEFELERSKFKEAIEALRAGNEQKFVSLKTQLKDYVLAPYLDQIYLLDRVDLKNRKAIETFLAENGDEPISYPLRYKFLKMLARHNQTDLFLTHYQNFDDPSLECHQLRLRLKTSESKSQIFSDAERLWLYGRSRPDACDPVFSSMKKNHFLSESLIWQRLLLAVKAEQKSLVRYLSSQLSEHLKPVGQIAVKAVSNPQHIAQFKPKSYQQPAYTELATIIINKRLWADPDDGLALYEKLSSKYDFTIEQKLDLAKTAALSLVSSNHPRASEWLDSIPNDQMNEVLARWKLAHQLRNGDWQKVKEWAALYQQHDSSNPLWLYWQARAEQEQGNLEKAAQLLTELSKERSYYGFLASARINQAPSIASQDYQSDPQTLANLDKNLQVVRARELWLAGKHLSARREWNQVKAYATESEKFHLALIAHKWQWHEQTIISLAELKRFDAVAYRFPFAFAEAMEKASQSVNLDITLSLAVARKESAFRPDARSAVGAVGLMQLMPSTAKRVAKFSPNPIGKLELTDPNVNTQLGATYLRELLDMHSGNEVLVAASYNAGEHRVKQ